MRSLLSTLLAATLLFTVANRAQAAETVSETDRETAITSIKGFAQNLKDTLSKAMQEGGPVAAISACHLEAPKIAASGGDAGWQVGRTSLKVRNLANAPDAWEYAVLQEFEQAKAAGADPKTLSKAAIVEVDGVPTVRFMKAIPTAELCLQCHGSEINAEVVAALDARYPHDAARGFKAGDLRGAFTLQKPLK